MKKPTLKDFNLNEKKIDLLEEQKEVFKTKEKEIFSYNAKVKEEKSKADKIKYIIVVVIWIVMAFICGWIGESCGDATIIIFVAILSFILPALFVKIYNENCSAYKLNEKKINRCDYINEELEKNYNSYLYSLNEYEELSLKIQKDFWINLNGYEFEDEVANLFQKLGYDTQVTQSSRDGGVDIIMHKDNISYAVQCKHFNKPVGPAQVRELRGVLDDYDRGIFVSLNGYTETVIQENRYAKRKIELLSLSDLVKFSQQVSLEKFGQENNFKKSSNIIETNNNVTKIPYIQPKSNMSGVNTNINNIKGEKQYLKKTHNLRLKKELVKESFINAEIKSVQSSYIREIGYCNINHVLFVFFKKSNCCFYYENVPKSTFESFYMAESKKGFYDALIQNNYPEGYFDLSDEGIEYIKEKNATKLYCSRCHNEISGYDKVCPYCGAEFVD